MSSNENEIGTPDPQQAPARLLTPEMLRQAIRLLEDGTHKLPLVILPPGATLDDLNLGTRSDGA